MRLHTLQPAPGAKSTRKRVGRGTSSGHGKTSGFGHRGRKPGLVVSENAVSKEDKHPFTEVT